MWDSIKMFLIRRMIDVNGRNIDISKYDNRAEVTRWVNLYEGKPNWVTGSDSIESRGVAAAVVSELAKKVTIEMSSSVEGGDRAEYINKQYQRLIGRTRGIVGQLLVQGSGILKPFISGSQIGIEYVTAENFIPIKFDDFDNLVEVIFLDKVKTSKFTYTKVETHVIEPDGSYTITNEAFLGQGTYGKMGTKVSLKEVAEWAHLEPEVNLANIKHPFYVYLKTPFDNNFNMNSPLGVSVFSKVEGLFKDYDETYSSMMWEFKGSELKVFVPQDFIDIDVDNNFNSASRPTKEQLSNLSRLYVGLSMDPMNKGSKLEVFSPTIRQQSYMDGLEVILRKIEFNTGLGYGILSQADSVDKTAEEIRSSKERSYATILDIQKKIEYSYRHVIHVIDTMADLYAAELGAPKKSDGDEEYEISFNFDKSIIVNKKQELEMMLSEVEKGLQRPEFYLMERYGLTLQEALDRLPREIVTPVNSVNEED